MPTEGITSVASAPLSLLQVTNQCVLVCELGNWSGEESPAWRLLTGTQDEIGQCLAKYFGRYAVRRLDDFGGVCETFLCNNDVYVDSPPRVKPGAAVFSFTPKKRVLAEAGQMARVCARAGYSLLILAVQKHDKFGKVWVLLGVLRHLATDSLTYYEDTNSIIDELKASPEGKRVVAVHVQVPGYEAHTSQLADRVISQSAYQESVLQQ
jgi:hypothetical protein